jgi:hypothetical protein
MGRIADDHRRTNQGGAEVLGGSDTNAVRTHIESYWLAAAEGGDATALKASQVDAIEDAFEAAGLVFTNGEEPR